MHNAHSIGKAAACLLLAAILLAVLTSYAVADVRINAEDYPGTFEQGGASIAVGPTGDYIVTWTDQRSGVPIPYLQRFSSDGTPIGANSKLDENAIYTFGNWWVSAPEVAENGSGVTAIVAPTKRADMANHVALWIFDSEGDLTTGPIQVSDLTSGGGGDYEPFAAAVDINDAGQICVAWSEYRTHTVFARWYDQNGNAVTDVFSLNPVTEGDTVSASYPVTVDINSAGRAVIASEGSVNHVPSALAWLLDYGSTDLQRVTLDQQIIYGGDTTYALDAPCIVLRDDGSFAAVLFREIEKIMTGGYYILGTDILFQRFDQNGTKR